MPGRGLARLSWPTSRSCPHAATLLSSHLSSAALLPFLGAGRGQPLRAGHLGRGPGLADPGSLWSEAEVTQGLRGPWGWLTEQGLLTGPPGSPGTSHWGQEKALRPKSPSGSPFPGGGGISMIRPVAGDTPSGKGHDDPCNCSCSFKKSNVKTHEKSHACQSLPPPPPAPSMNRWHLPGANYMCVKDTGSFHGFLLDGS